MYENKTDEYVAWEITEGTKFEVPEGLGVGDRINEIDMEDAIQRMLEKSNKDFANNENSYRMVKEFDRPWRPFVPKGIKRYGLGKSQKEIMRGSWIAPGYNTTPKSYQTSRRY